MSINAFTIKAIDRQKNCQKIKYALMTNNNLHRKKEKKKVKKSIVIQFIY